MSRERVAIKRASRPATKIFDPLNLVPVVIILPIVLFILWSTYWIAEYGGCMVDYDTTYLVEIRPGVYQVQHGTVCINESKRPESLK
jgi:hypothetical protein